MVGAQYNFTPSIFMSLTASESRYLPSHDVAADEFKYGLFGAANIYWNMTPRIQVAAEYDLGQRRDFSGKHRTAQRVNMMCQFSF
ncbi:MAG: hypothetical protein K2M55_00345 [Muribaculaceae bacterium]|nr:hypothetical protein [Muribaculaceae bacterium]